MGKHTRAVLILLLYAAVLFLLLGRAPLWLDEILQLDNSREHRTFSQLIDWVLVNPGASPLPYMFQKFFVDHWGFSNFVVRLPAALCSIACGVMFWIVARSMRLGKPVVALLLFLAVPLQFRYGVEGRVYSQALLFSLLSLYLFLRLRQQPSTGRAVLYGLSVLAGLYTQPLTIFPAAAQALWTLVDPAGRPLRRHVIAAVALSALAYAPWYLVERKIQADLPTVFGFTFHQVRPLVLLHDLAGDGYACSIPLILLALAGVVRRAPDRRLLLCTVAVCIAGPIAMDLAADYFFAERQMLFAMPALILLASHGADAYWRERYGLAVCAVLVVFFVAAVVNDRRLGIAPRDDLDATADGILNRLHPDSCFLANPRETGYYIFLRPELNTRTCSTPPSASELLMVVDAYTRPPERQALLDAVTAYQRTGSAMIGRNEIFTYTRR